MSDSTSKRFRSTFHDINLDLLKKLCDLHPWTRSELCKSVDMEPAVLSMVLAGKRPLPGRVAKKFLDLMGMKEDGSLDNMHGFVFKERPGREAELLEVLAMLYADEDVTFPLKAAVADPEHPDKPPFFSQGLLFFNRQYQSVVHTYHGSKLHLRWSPIDANSVKLGIPPEALLSTRELPTKRDMATAVAYNTFERGAKWSDVIQAARKRNVQPREVLAWLEANFSVPKIESADSHRLE